MQGLGEHMQFCPKCGGLMLPKKVGKDTVLECSSCGHIEKSGKMEGY
ncbi:MAG TPA: hypothetical protein ENF64_03005, partial [Hadesarchaea archaeon]|nr:hypothetical protein [Hadesarchaea archaeon]